MAKTSGDPACMSTCALSSTWALSCAMTRTTGAASHTEDGRAALREFVQLNREGFRKILKKWDKNHASQAMSPRPFSFNSPRRPNSPPKTKRSGAQSAAYMVAVNTMLREPVSQLEGLMDVMDHAPPGAPPTWPKALLFFVVCTVVTLVVAYTCARALAAFVLGLLAAALLAVANGANDIANSMGTSVGAGVLSVRQAILWGSVFEFLGAMTMGQFVAKEISKGVISASNYTGGSTDLFSFSMLCVLVAAGLVTLLATFYGFPISATHGIIGGLVAVGSAAKGASSIGWDKLGQMAVGWVLSPVVGGTVCEHNNLPTGTPHEHTLTTNHL
jgi:hypothetical protein